MVEFETCSKCFKSAICQSVLDVTLRLCRGCQIDLERWLGYLKTVKIDVAAMIFQQVGLFKSVTDEAFRQAETEADAVTPPPPTVRSAPGKKSTATADNTV